jgi:hypothetical protein
MRRYGGGDEVFARRRLFAVAGIIAVVVILFVVLVGC